jgi:hypothetical protein
MRSTAVLACLLGAFVAGESGRAGEPPCGCQAETCFPRSTCLDDYCPSPYPRQCWPPYPAFYQCVPAGVCSHPPCVGVGNEKLTWWWIPTLRALREALWLNGPDTHAH